MTDSGQPDLVAMLRDLLSERSAAALSTHSIKHEGYPFTSAVPFALDDQGRPLILASGLATHTRNLKADPNASLLIAAGETQADARATIMGTLEQVPEADRDRALAVYLERHPAARQWASFGDFALYRMNIVDIYFVGGFGVMGWVKPEQYASN